MGNSSQFLFLVQISHFRTKIYPLNQKTTKMFESLFRILIKCK